MSAVSARNVPSSTGAAFALGASNEPTDGSAGGTARAGAGVTSLENSGSERTRSLGDSTGSAGRYKRSAARKRPSGGFGRLDQSEITRGFIFRVMTSTAFSHFINSFSTGVHGLHGLHGYPLRVKLALPLMLRVVGVLFLAAMCPSLASAQVPASRVLFRVFLSDGRVLSSYGVGASVEGRSVRLFVQLEDVTRVVQRLVAELALEDLRVKDPPVEQFIGKLFKQGQASR